MLLLVLTIIFKVRGSQPHKEGKTPKFQQVQKMTLMNVWQLVSPGQAWSPAFFVLQVQHQSEQGAGQAAPVEGGQPRRPRGAFDPEDPTMLRPLRLCVRPPLRPEVEGGEASGVAGDGGVRHPEQGGAHRASVS